MKHRIRFFKQHSNETCGIACALILLDYYDRKVSYPTPKMEAKLYKNYKSAALKKGVPGAQLACLLARNKLDVKLIHSSENILENRGGYFAPEVFDAFLSEYTAKLQEYKALYAFEKGVDITPDTVKAELFKSYTHCINTCTIIVSNEGRCKTDNNRTSALNKHLCLFNLTCNFLCVLWTDYKTLTT